MLNKNDSINEQINQALEKNPSIKAEDIYACAKKCIKIFSSEDVTYGNVGDFTLITLESIGFYLSTNDLSKSVNKLMSMLSALVASNADGINFRKTSARYKRIYSSVSAYFEEIPLKVPPIQPNEETTPIQSSEETSPRRKKGRGRPEKKNVYSKQAEDENDIPDDLEWIDGTSDLFISPSQGQAYVKRGGIKTYYRKVFSTLPSKVVKLHVPGAYKGQATQFRVTINDQTETFTFDDLRYGKWYELFKKTIGVANVPSNGQYAQIINHLANKSEMEHLFLQTGIHEVDGIYGYLLPNGDFITDKEYKTPVNFAHKPKGDLLEIWDNWNDIASQWDDKAAIDAIKYCLGLTPMKGQAIVLLCHHARTLSRSVRSGNFRTGHLLYVRGKAGSGKTSLTCLTANVAKPSIYDGSLEANYKGTKASIEKTIDEYSDIPFIIDDFEPGDSQAEKKSGEALLTAMAKSAYDGTSIRPRQNGDMSDKKSNYVYTFPTTTSILYPSDLSEGALRRTFFVEVSKGDVNTSEGTFNLTYAHDNHKDGLAKLGRRILLLHIKNLNNKGTRLYADERKHFFTEYKQNIRKRVNLLWSEKFNSDIPGIADNLLNIAANITLGAKDIDDVTNNACNLVDYIQEPIAKMVFDQLMLIEGMRNIEGDSLLEEALKELFANVSGSIPVLNKLYRVIDYRSKDVTSPNVSINYEGKDYKVPSEQWEGVSDGNGRDSLVLGYVDIDKEDFSKSILYLTKSGREALLQVASNTEGLEHVKTKTKLSQLLDKEGWIIKRNGQEITVPCNPKSTKAQEKCIALSFERLLNLIFDIKSFVESQEEVKENKLDNKQNGKNFDKKDSSQLSAEDMFNSFFLSNPIVPQNNVTTPEDTPKKSETKLRNKRPKKGE
jgi:hypothetical protein